MIMFVYYTFFHRMSQQNPFLFSHEIELFLKNAYIRSRFALRIIRIANPLILYELVYCFIQFLQALFIPAVRI